MLNYDSIGSPNGYNAVYDATELPSSTPRRAVNGSRVISSVHFDYFRRQGLPYDSTGMGGGSDYVGFLELGVACGGLYGGLTEVKARELRDRYEAALGPGRGGIANAQLDPCYHRSVRTRQSGATPTRPFLTVRLLLLSPVHTVPISCPLAGCAGTATTSRTSTSPRTSAWCVLRRTRPPRWPSRRTFARSCSTRSPPSSRRRPLAMMTPSECHTPRAVCVLGRGMPPTRCITARHISCTADCEGLILFHPPTRV